MMKMEDCPRFHSCNAPICPFYGGGVHLSGEATCFYIREFYKKDAKANFENAGVEHIYADLEQIAPKVAGSSRLIRKEIEKASKTKSRLARVRSKKTKAGMDEKGVYGTVTGSGVGKGTSKGTYNPIPPLPGAGNGISEASLTGDRNRCPTCLEYFASSKAFDQHRTGMYNGRRRCLTLGEMKTKGFGKTRDGFWLCPVSEKDRERLTVLRQKQ